MGSQRVRHDRVTSLSLFTFTHWRRKWQPTPVFLPGESQGREPGGLLSMGSHRVGHDWRDLAAAVCVCVCVCVGMCEENESGKAYIQTYFKDIFEGWLLSNKRWEEFDQREICKLPLPSMQIDYLLLLNKSLYHVRAMFKCLRSE